ncbi:hypothetical protein HU765_15250 [Pseudomonas sp. SWRI81]|uniref:hypothetical protein n=1 Tax=Pseudomonas sp. SWRI81 TaxID=2745505 RepID=UPI001645353F|nr:hypothetical protein [Pseudomonas sp. SWRI81]MBC3271299.1 hypothetical protein [Pseudomonas sp. SWRI81]
MHSPSMLADLTPSSERRPEQARSHKELGGAAGLWLASGQRGSELAHEEAGTFSIEVA